MSKVFFSYSHKDESLRDQLEIHLAMLKHQGVISTWHDRRLAAGDHVDAGISSELEQADIILLLVSADFLASSYCYGVEMKLALERHEKGEARVIPVILRPCEWTHAPFGRLLASPTDGKPVTKWADPDDAYLDIAKAIRSVASQSSNPVETTTPVASPPRATPAEPRSSNLRVRKNFTARDRDRFLDEAFEYMARFFENSLKELSARNPGLEGAFKQIDATRFSAAAYRDGDILSRCQIRLGGPGGGITFSHGNLGDNSWNESLSVEDGEQSLYLRPIGMQFHRNVSGESRLGLEGVAEYYWSLFIQPLQR